MKSVIYGTIVSVVPGSFADKITGEKIEFYHAYVLGDNASEPMKMSIRKDDLAKVKAVMLPQSQMDIDIQSKKVFLTGIGSKLQAVSS